MASERAQRVDYVVAKSVGIFTGYSAECTDAVKSLNNLGAGQERSAVVIPVVEQVELADVSLALCGFASPDGYDESKAATDDQSDGANDVNALVAVSESSVRPIPEYDCDGQHGGDKACDDPKRLPAAMPR